MFWVFLQSETSTKHSRSFLQRLNEDFVRACVFPKAKKKKKTTTKNKSGEKQNDAGQVQHLQILMMMICGGVKVINHSKHNKAIILTQTKAINSNRVAERTDVELL